MRGTTLQACVGKGKGRINVKQLNCIHLKLNVLLNCSKIGEVTVPWLMLFHNLMADGKKEYRCELIL